MKERKSLSSLLWNAAGFALLSYPVSALIDSVKSKEYFREALKKPEIIELALLVGIGHFVYHGVEELIRRYTNIL